jgi:DNA-binding transcriptional LysR family regulator
MDFDLDLADSFLAVVDEWHFGRAARQLNLSPPALSKRIRRLEGQLGVPLIDRGPEGVVGLTTAGLRFATAARPLLDRARSAAKTARTEPSRYTLRVGVPSGSGTFLSCIDVAGVEHDLRHAFPPVRVAFVEVPFPSVSRSLPQHQIDVLLTIAPVRHPGVESLPLPLTSHRIGLVAPRHPLAEFHAVEVEKFCDYVLLYNPAIPVEWMRPFWLADVRPFREARLIETDGAHNGRVERDASAGVAAMVSLEPARRTLSSNLRAVSLAGAAPVRFYAARRRDDRRGFVNTYLGLLQALQPQSLTANQRPAPTQIAD